jgi:lipoprotein-anchoring transpeptidase ErfK/SrfK
MKTQIISLTIATMALFVSPATAGDRYLPKPPVVLSPDLASPWVMQIRGSQSQQRNVQQGYVQQRQIQPRATTTRSYQPKVQKRKVRQASLQPKKSKKSAAPQLDSQFLPQVVSYQSSDKPGTIMIDTQSRHLYLVLGNGEARRYGVGVGKAGFDWTGVEKITQKKEWPSWRPPSEMIAREKKKGRILPKYMEGGPANPLGARALYLGSTLYRIHGTNQPWTIGQAVSSGCIRMRNQDVVDLYERAKVGAKVRVI